MATKKITPSNQLPISVIITVLNEAASVERLLDALVAQLSLPSEIVMVDGGSDDETVALIKKWATHHSQVPVHVLVKAGNRSVGRNWAISHAKHDWLAITDAGCVPHPDWLRQLWLQAETVAAEQKQQPQRQEIVVAGYYDALATTAFQRALVPYVLVMPDQVNPHYFLPATRSMLLTRTAWELVGKFDEQLSDNEDYAFAQALAKHPDITVSFAGAAKVSWIPRSTLAQAARMFWRFARGDAQAGLWRPKVLLLFARYCLLLVLIFIAAAMGWWQQLAWLLAAGVAIYGWWAIAKNYRYAKQGWYWLPILQITADGAVLWGTICGWWRALAITQ